MSKLSRITVTTSRRLLKITSEPYVLYERMGFTPVVDVEDMHSGEIGYLIISALSLSESLKAIADAKNCLFKGLTISIQKESSARVSKYILEVRD